MPPVVLIHGAGGSHLSWPPEIRRMHGTLVFTLDLPGHGKSGGVGKQSAGEYANTIVQFMDDVSLWKAVIIGHSMGSAIALSLALQTPERVAGLVLLSGGAHLPVAAHILENSANPSTFQNALKSLQNGLFGSGAEVQLMERTSKLLSETRPSVLHGDLVACNNFDVMRSLKKLSVPTLVLCGTEDRLTPLRLSISLSNAVAGSALQTIDGAGHMVMLEQPRRVTSLLSMFLKTIPYTPGM